MKKNNYCLYKHTSPSNKVYIGITQQSVEKRWQNGYGYKTNHHFWNAIQKYGWNNFEHAVLIENLTEKEAKKLEKEYIALFNCCNTKYGYNKTEGGDVPIQFTIEIRDKMSKNHADFSRGNHPQAKKVYKYEKINGNYICEYNCVKDASDENNISEESISGVARGTGYTAGGYRWSYIKQDSLGYFRYLQKTAIQIYQYDLNGNYLNSYECFADVTKKYGFTITKKQVLNKTLKSHNFLWSLDKKEKIEYHNVFEKPVCCYDVNEKVIAKYKSIKDAVTKTGITTISGAVRGVYKTAGGYVWKYVEI